MGFVPPPTPMSNLEFLLRYDAFVKANGREPSMTEIDPEFAEWMERGQFGGPLGLRDSAIRMVVAFVAVALIVAFLAFALAAHAEPKVERCIAPRKGQITQPCVPPPTYTAPNAPVPFNAPTKFGRESKIGGEGTFVWIKAGEPPRPCTPAEARQGPSYRQACAARIGDELYEIGKFRAVAAPLMFAESMAVATAVPSIRRLEGVDLYGDFAGERFCHATTENVTCKGKRRFNFVAIQVADMLRGQDKESATDDIVLEAERHGAVRVTGHWPSRRSVNSWMVVPVETDSEYVAFYVVGERLATPLMRIRDLHPITYGELR